jgi:hypothetical protein
MMMDPARIEDEERLSKWINCCELRLNSRHNSSKRVLTKLQVDRTKYSTYPLCQHQRTNGRRLSPDPKNERIIHFDVARSMRKRTDLNSDPRSSATSHSGEHEWHASTVSNSTSYLSPIRRSKEATKSTRVPSCDISVDFSSNSDPITSPRSVLDDFLFDTRTHDHLEQIDQLLWGVTSVAMSVESHDSLLLPPDSLQTPSWTPDAEHILLDEGVVWKRILEDLKGIRHFQFMEANARTSQSPPAIHHSTTVSLPALCADRGDSKLRFDGYPRRLSMQPAVSNDNLTVSTYASSDQQSMTGLWDITVQDTRPPWRALVRQVSTLFLPKEMRWTVDKDVASLLPQHAVVSAGTGNESCYSSGNESKRRRRRGLFKKAVRRNSLSKSEPRHRSRPPKQKSKLSQWVSQGCKSLQRKCSHPFRVL